MVVAERWPCSGGSNVEDIAWSREDTKRASEIFFNTKKKTVKNQTPIFFLAVKGTIYYVAIATSKQRVKRGNLVS